MENPFNTQENKPTRSGLLTTLLILTFIWSGISFIGNVYVMTSFDSVIEYVEDVMDDESMAALTAVLEQSIQTMEKVGVGYFGLLALLLAIGLAGAVFMWRLNKFGFHLYASAQIIMLFIPMVFGLIKYPGVFDTAISALFIWLYARELKIFNKEHVQG
ncbi:MAG: hypothetical protein FWG79_03400 [Bacteroidales bacterium]|nr:hypothetical protein [Bacteroidales bacterium]